MAHDLKITLKIDVKKLRKEVFYHGEKGVYCTLTIVPTPDNKFGDDYMVTQYVGKKPEGERDPIVGNGRDLIFDNSNKNLTLHSNNGAPVAVGVDENDGDDLPF